jgi:hypothetical protein
MRAFPKTASRKRCNKPTNRPEKDRKSDRTSHIVFLPPDHVADDAVNNEPENNPFHYRLSINHHPYEEQYKHEGECDQERGDERNHENLGGADNHNEGSA